MDRIYQDFEELAGRAVQDGRKAPTRRPAPLSAAACASPAQRLGAGITMLIIDKQLIAPALAPARSSPRAVPRIAQRNLVGDFRVGFPVLQICTVPRLS
jgi:hypothetical protein